MRVIKIKPIGKVKRGREKVLSKIIIQPELSECLDGLEEYSHIVILYWMHKIKTTKRTLQKGALANRSPFRPNPIGLTIVELIRREGNVLTVKGLDAFDGSPVIDIKPYTGHPRDLVLDFKSPERH